VPTAEFSCRCRAGRIPAPGESAPRNRHRCVRRVQTHACNEAARHATNGQARHQRHSSRGGDVPAFWSAQAAPPALPQIRTGNLVKQISCTAARAVLLIHRSPLRRQSDVLADGRGRTDGRESRGPHGFRRHDLGKARVSSLGGGLDHDAHAVARQRRRPAPAATAAMEGMCKPVGLWALEEACSVRGFTNRDQPARRYRISESTDERRPPPWSRSRLVRHLPIRAVPHS
jgi:hypothetical protein